MFRRNLIPVWVAIILLSGMFLMGQESWIPQECIDNDEDGYADIACGGDDCDDANADVYPGALEICDGVDNQCPGDTGYGETDEEHEGMACIPEGCFDMGDHFAEGNPDELPVHNVCITAFEMDIHEVTNADYRDCVTGSVCSVPSDTNHYDDPVYGRHPVVFVSWDQANTYCAWTGKRLPTEAEWEYAARGGLSGKRYPWGDTIIGSDANYWDSGDPWDNATGEIEYYVPNGYGLYDMVGNVWERVNEWYDPEYYQYCVDHGIVNDPPGPASGTYRVFRGGSYANLSIALRLSIRDVGTDSGSSSAIGFRCARGGAYGP